MLENSYLLPQKKTNGLIYIILLFLSFIWINLYVGASSLVGEYLVGFGNLLDFSSQYFATIASSIFFQSVVDWIIFECLFYFYRYILSYKIYSFIVPPYQLKNESRIYFIYRNICYGIFVNLCFLYPYLYAYSGLINLIVTLVMTLVFCLNLNKKYAEPLVGHFVFKCFCYPLFVFEALTLIFQMLEMTV